MAKMTFKDPDPTFTPIPGQMDQIGDGLRRVLAPNPSPMTFRGTNTYILGEGKVAVIDPGPAHPDHMRAIQEGLSPGETISHIVVTHAHLDHSPLARPLSQATGAPVLAYGDAHAGRSAVMTDLARASDIGGGEGIDHAFRPDETVACGDRIDIGDLTLDVQHTPGHLGNHITLAWGDVLLTGDLVMGWATSLVSPPDGDLTDFMASCRRLARQRWSRFLPGHGAVIDAPNARLDALIAHREGREAQILAALASSSGTASQLAARIYTDTPPALLPAATRNVLAHLIDLMQKNKVEHDGTLHADATFALR